MDLINFLGLPEAEQWEEFSENGIFLAQYRDIDVHNMLYRLYDFYVELSSSPVSTLHQVMNAFISGPRLEKYEPKNLEDTLYDLDIEPSPLQ